MSEKRTNSIARCCLAAVAVLCVMAHGKQVVAGDDISCLGDEFNSAGSISGWQRINVVEQWFADQLETWDIDTTQAGRMVMMPYTSSWYQNYRGPLVFKEIDGDFAVTADITVTGRSGGMIDLASQYSLAGLMIRTPRDITPQTWTTGGENYVFLSIGYGSAAAPTWQFEIKTTIDSDSTLVLSPSPANTVKLQIVRIGEAVICLRQSPGQPWVVHGRYFRDDFPDVLQVGAVTYTDWEKVNDFSWFTQNSTSLHLPLPMGVNDPTPFVPFNPDLVAAYDYIRFVRPFVPAELGTPDLTNPAEVSDETLLTFLGASLDMPVPSTPGDLDCNCVLDFDDVYHFVTALSDPGSFDGCDMSRADINNDLAVDGDDLQGFVNLLWGV